MQRAYASELDLHCASGLRAMTTGDLLTAQGEYISALKIDPNCFEAVLHLALIFMSSGRLPAAEAMALRAVRLEPNAQGAWNNLGYILCSEGKWVEGEQALRKALELQRIPGILHTLGLCLHALGRFDEAIAAYDEALKSQPDCVEWIDHRGQSLLGAGYLTAGLIDNKIRWQFIMCHPLMASPIAEWNGEPLEGKTIIVLHEQGFGDTLQCVRWVPLLKSQKKAARVILSVPGSIADLFRCNDLADEVIGIKDVPESGFGSVDYKIPMMTVPALFDASKTNIPTQPYIKAPLRKPVLPKGGFKVGLVWGGKPMYAQDQWRSMDPTSLLPLFDLPGVSFYSLQADERGQQLWQSGIAAWVKDLAPMIRDWSDTAALVDELDLLVSVDTAPAHLAGAMGKPVALMIPEASCWRWFDHSTTTTPWYPSMTLFRQQRQGDWGPVIKAVREFIRDL